MKINKYSRFFAILKQVNTNGLALTKEQAVSNYTDGRSTSLSSLSIGELTGLEQSLSTLISQRRLNMAELDPVRDPMRKAIIAIFKSIGKDTPDAKRWAEKYGVFGQKRLFNDYTEQELYQMIRNAEKMKEDHINAINHR